MTIEQVLLSNTFNEFRSTVNDVTNTVNSFTDGTGSINANAIDSGTLDANRLAVSGASAGTYGSASQVPVIVVDDKGRITSASNTDVAGVENFAYFSANATLRIETADGNSFEADISEGLDFSSLNATAITSGTLDADRLATSGVSAGTYGSASQVPVIVVDDKGRITSASNTNVAGVQAFDFYSSNATLVITTSDGGSASADISGETAGSSNTTYIKYNGTTKTAGQFYGATTDPDGTTRLNYDGYFYSTKFYGDGSALTGISGGADITDDTSTNSNAYYPVLTTLTSGSMTSANVSTTKLYFNPSTGTLNATEFNSLSDETLKKNITIVENAVDTVNALNGVEFEWKETGQKSSGLIAQNVETVLAHLVNENDGIKSINYSGVIAYLVESIKELDKRVKELENKNGTKS